MKSLNEQSELRDLNYPIYLCTSFAPLNNQSLLQDLISLSCQLTIAVTQPSEQMLRAIRIQWWIDCLTELKLQNSPLSDRIISYINADRIEKEKVLFILEAFQNATFEDSAEENLRMCWRAVFEYYCILSGNEITEATGLLGSLVSYIIYNPSGLQKMFQNSELENEMKVINSIKTEDGFIKSCVCLLYLSKNNKLNNFTLLPIRLFLLILKGSYFRLSF